MPCSVAAATVFPTLKDAEILKLSRKITVEASAEKDEIMKKQGYPPDDVDIYTTASKVYSGAEPFVKGHPQNPMSFEECVEKFRRCVEFSAKLLPAKRLDEFLRQAEKLEDIDDVRGIVANLS